MGKWFNIIGCFLMPSSLAKIQTLTPKSDDEMFNMKKDAWHKDGVLILNSIQIKSLSPFNQDELTAIASYFYGARK